MKFEKFSPKEHLPLIREWMEMRGMALDPGDADMYPESGYVADDCAIAFLYKTDAKAVAYMDGLITDPMVSMAQAHRAVDALCEKLLEDAKGSGVRLVFLNTAYAGIASLASRHGFIQFGDGYRALVKGVI